MKQDKVSLYPLVFEPIFKETIWGGQEIRRFKGLSPSDEKIGESWEISHVPSNYSVVANGSLAGLDLNELMHRYEAELLGKHVFEQFAYSFPLLIKFIDAQDKLSIQVHPNDEQAKARHNSMGKTEMWYVIKGSETASIYCGFKETSSPEDYLQRLKDNSITEILKNYQVQAGDVFHLPAGRVHAIGAGCLIAEIQQSSNITYRIWDYARRDKDGNLRELHSDLAKDVLDFTVLEDYQTHYTPKKDSPVLLERCPYFQTNLLELEQIMTIRLDERDSCSIYMVLEGGLDFIDHQDYSVHLEQGHSILIPANCPELRLVPKNSCKLIETFIP